MEGAPPPHLGCVSPAGLALGPREGSGQALPWLASELLGEGAGPCQRLRPGRVYMALHHPHHPLAPSPRPHKGPTVLSHPSQEPYSSPCSALALTHL